MEKGPIYDCSVNKNRYRTCGECDIAPCGIFFEWKDPGGTDEEHRRGVEINVERLKGIRNGGVDCAVAQ